MAHSNLTSQECSRKCVHGKCLNHDPEWENVGEKEYKPNPGIFKKTYWLSRCCGRAMAQYKEVQRRQCQKCGSYEDFVTYESIALCLCCGCHFKNSIQYCDG